jgi:hypothetical protein
MKKKVSAVRKQNSDLLKRWDAEELLFWSFRYFLGRGSIRAACFVNELLDSLPYMNRYHIALICQDLESEFAYVARLNETRSDDKQVYLGMFSDVEQSWRKVYEKARELHAAQKAE